MASPAMRLLGVNLGSEYVKASAEIEVFVIPSSISLSLAIINTNMPVMR